jgi:hypothetical protein
MKKFLVLAAIATLFVLYISLLPAFGAVTTQAPSAGDCTTIEMLIPPQEKEKLVASGAEFITLTREQTARLNAMIEEKFQVKPPEPVPQAYVIKGPGGIFIFHHTEAGCHVTGSLFRSPDMIERFYKAIEGDKT